MDILLGPENPTFPVERTPFVSSSERWDGGQFFDYARRCRQPQLVPAELGAIARTTIGAFGLGNGNDSDENNNGHGESYAERLHPTPATERQRVFQTWFFFGLLSEFLGLNELPGGGGRAMGLDEARRGIEQLYRDCVVVVDDAEGGSFVTGAKVVGMKDVIASRVRTQTEQGMDLQSRVAYLQACLQFTQGILARSSDGIEPSVLFSIAGLGELLSTFINAFLLLGSSGLTLAPVSRSWHYSMKFGAPESEFVKQMLRHGWCPSDVNRMCNMYSGLNTVHYLSRLRKAAMPLDHSEYCSLVACLAGQIDLRTYKPLHAKDGCDCELFHVDIDAVQRILATTSSFPVLGLGSSAQDAGPVEVTVEPYRRGVQQFVALSHVWADGLGNPVSNAIQSCQVQSLARLVSSLKSQSGLSLDPNAGTSEDTVLEYKLWIDTLCCPVELNGKVIALRRIRDVYREASHVLVLDSPLTCFNARGVNPAEILLRIFGSSAWMRRLWTLHEGALARSLLFQFRDGAVNPVRLLIELFTLIQTDIRYLRIYQDISTEFSRLHGFFQYTHPSYSGTLSWPPADITTLQWALLYRGVTVAADEPLCIATLLSLPLESVLELRDVDERMAHVWRMWADKNGGFFPSRVIFALEESVRKPGWRWAPRSLLTKTTTTTTTEEYGKLIDQSLKLTRFIFAPGSPDSWRPCHIGMPTEAGLRVQLGGAIVQAVPRLADLTLHPWGNLMRGVSEDYLPVYEETEDGSGAVVRKWFTLVDAYRSLKLPAWSPEQLAEYDRVADWPLHRMMDAGGHALIFPPDDDDASGSLVGQALLVAISQSKETNAGNAGEQDALFVHRKRQLYLEAIPPDNPSVIAYETVRELADLLARDAATKQLTEARMAHGEEESDEYETARVAVRRRAEEIMEEAWTARPGFADAVHDAVGAGLREYMFATMARWFSHDIKLERLPPDQVWFVD